ncbi:MAG TPA: hypothetical protein VF461_09115 [Gemmatimonadaceae bacterium]
MRLRSVFLMAAVPSLLSGCTTFATVRSAEPYVGPSVAVQGSASTPPGEIASWFWSFDCAEACRHPIVGGDLGFTYGWRPNGGPRAVALGAGISGVNPYVDGYVQLAGGPRPFGLGARLGAAPFGWRENQIYGRYDIPVNAQSRVLLNPGLFVSEGHSPNGGSSGRFLGFVQGVGLQTDSDYLSCTPSVGLVAGQAQRDRYGRVDGPESTVFAIASVGFTWHGRRVKPEH